MSDNVLTVKCPDCGELMTAPRSWAGREMSCPACLATVRLPSGKPTNDSDSEGAESSKGSSEVESAEVESADDTYELSGRSPTGTSGSGTDKDFESAAETIPLRQPSASDPFADKTHALGPVHDAPLLKVDVFEALARVRREPNAKPPARVFLSNVFEFPWSSVDVFLRWLWTALGLTLASVGFGVCLMTIQESGMLGWMLAGFFMMAIVACLLSALSYAASCANTILQETAAGNDQIMGWSEGGVVDWIFEFLPLFYIYLVSGTVALAIALPLELVWGYLTPQLLVTQLFTFPVTWLCALDASSMWVPFSPAVLRTIPQLPRIWAQFMAISISFLATLFVGLAYLVDYQPWVGAVLVGPVVASVLFIYPRLLGRLIWKISDIVNRDAKRRDPRSLKPASKRKQTKKK